MSDELKSTENKSNTAGVSQQRSITSQSSQSADDAISSQIDSALRLSQSLKDSGSTSFSHGGISSTATNLHDPGANYMYGRHLHGGPNVMRANNGKWYTGNIAVIVDFQDKNYEFSNKIPLPKPFSVVVSDSQSKLASNNVFDSLRGLDTSTVSGLPIVKPRADTGITITANTDDANSDAGSVAAVETPSPSPTKLKDLAKRAEDAYTFAISHTTDMAKRQQFSNMSRKECYDWLRAVYTAGFEDPNDLIYTRFNPDYDAATHTLKPKTPPAIAVPLPPITSFSNGSGSSNTSGSTSTNTSSATTSQSSGLYGTGTAGSGGNGGGGFFNFGGSGGNPPSGGGGPSGPGGGGPPGGDPPKGSFGPFYAPNKDPPPPPTKLPSSEIVPHSIPNQVRVVKVLGQDSRFIPTDAPELEDRDSFARYEADMNMWLLQLGMRALKDSTRAAIKTSQVDCYTDPTNRTEALETLNLLEQRMVGAAIKGLRRFIPDMERVNRACRYDEPTENASVYDFLRFWNLACREFNTATTTKVNALLKEWQAMKCSIDKDPRDFYNELDMKEIELIRLGGGKSIVEDDVYKGVEYRDKVPSELETDMGFLDMVAGVTGTQITGTMVKNGHITAWMNKYSPFAANRIAGSSSVYAVGGDSSDDAPDADNYSDHEVFAVALRSYNDRKDWKNKKRNNAFLRKKKSFNRSREFQSKQYRPNGNGNGNYRSNGNSSNGNGNYRPNGNSSKSNPSYTQPKSKFRRPDEKYISKYSSNNTQYSFAVDDDEVYQDSDNSDNHCFIITGDDLYDDDDFGSEHVGWVQNEELRAEEFVLDTGSFSHIVTSKKYAIPGTLREHAPITLTAFSHSCAATHSCDIQLTPTIRINNCLIVKNGNANLISGSKIAKAGYHIVIEGENLFIFDPKKGNKSRPLIRFKLRSNSWTFFRQTPRVVQILENTKDQESSDIITVYDKPRLVRPAISKIPTRRPVDQEEESSTSSKQLQADITEKQKRMKEAAKKKAAESQQSSSSSSSSTAYLSRRYPNSAFAVSETITNEKLDQLHVMYGHQTLTKKHLAKLHIIYNGAYNPSTKCTVCISTKSKRAPIHSVAEYPGKATEPLQTIHGDTIGPISMIVNSVKQNCISYDGKLYSTTLVDEVSAYVVVATIKSKTEVANVIKDTISRLENQTDRKVKRLHTDGGTEFVNEKVSTFCNSKGIVHTQSTPYTPEHNGLAERYNGKIITIGRSLLAQIGGGPEKLWSFAYQQAGNILNLTPNAARDYKIPFETLFGYVPSINKLHLFGVDCYMLQEKHLQSKVQQVAIITMYIGYSSIQNGHIVLDPTTMRTRTTRTITVLDTFNGAAYLRGEISLQQLRDYYVRHRKVAAAVGHHDESKSQQLHDERNESEEEAYEVEDIIDCKVRGGTTKYLVKFVGYPKPEWIPKENMNAPDLVKAYHESHLQRNQPDFEDDYYTDDELPPLSPVVQQEERKSPASEIEEKYDQSASPTSPVTPVRSSVAIPASPPIRRSTRRNQRTRSPSPVHPPISRGGTQARGRGRGIRAPITSPTRSSSRIRGINPAMMVTSSEIRDEKFDESLMVLNPTEFYTGSTFIPKNYKEAINCADSHLWYAAMLKEFQGFESFNVGKEVLRTPDMNVIDVRWVYTIKRDSDGHIKEYKARLVVRGFEQVYGINFTNTYSPVVKGTSLKIQQVLAAQFGWISEQFDVTQAFLHAELPETIYCVIPSGFGNKSGKYVWLLNKALYGLKQAPLEWYKKMTGILNHLGYKILYNDNCVFYKHIGENDPMIICLYVDDAVVTYPKELKLQWKSDMEFIKNNLKLKELGQPEFILNMNIKKLSNDDIHLSNKKHIDKLIDTAGLRDSKTSPTPYYSRFSDGIKLDSADNPLNEDDHHLYRVLQGQLGYIALQSRPDLCYANYIASTKLQNPTNKDLVALRNIIRYVNGTQSYGLLLKAKQSKDIKVIVYVDANWGSIKETKSISGMIVMINDSIIEWSTSKQETTALSTSEAELKSAVLGSQTGLWVKNWLLIVMQLNVTPTIITDNQAALEIATNAKSSKRTKHLAIQDTFIREHISAGNIMIKWISTVDQLADGMTKELAGPKFTKFRNAVVVPGPTAEL